MNKKEILLNMIENFEEATDFSFNEFLLGEGFEEKEIEIIKTSKLLGTTELLDFIFTVEKNSDQSAKEFLIGEGFEEKEIEEILNYD